MFRLLLLKEEKKQTKKNFTITWEAQGQTFPREICRRQLLQQVCPHIHTGSHDGWLDPLQGHRCCGAIWSFWVTTSTQGSETLLTGFNQTQPTLPPCHVSIQPALIWFEHLLYQPVTSAKQSACQKSFSKAWKAFVPAVQEIWLTAERKVKSHRRVMQIKIRS